MQQSHRRQTLAVAFAFGMPLMVMLVAGFGESERTLLTTWFAFSNQPPTTSEPWRAWTAAWLSMDLGHAALGAVAWSAVALYAHHMRRFEASMLAAWIAWPISHWLLMLWPQAIQVVGLSGAVYALMAAVTVVGWATPAHRWAASTATAFLAVRIWIDAAWATPVGATSAWDWPVVHASHLSGIVAGSAVAAAILGWQRWLTRRESSPPISSSNTRPQTPAPPPDRRSL